LRTLSLLAAFLRLKLRDRFNLALTLFTTPAFVLAYWVFFAEARTSFTVLVLDQDRAAAGRRGLAPRSPDPVHAVLESLRHLASSDGTRLLEIREVGSRAALDVDLRAGQATAGLVVPSGFSAALAARGSPPAEITLTGDATSAGYRVTAILVERALNHLAHTLRGSSPPVLVREVPLGLSGARTPFEGYVPALLVFTVIMLIFSSSIAVVRQVEAGTLARLRLTPVGPVELLFGFSAIELLLGFAALVLTFSTARLLGFRSAGSLPLAMLISALASLATVGIGMFVASLSRSLTRAFLIASVAMFLLVLFSGLVFPRPRVTLFEIGPRAVDLFDAFPTTHMGVALEKVMTMGAGLGEIAYELGALGVIAAMNFTLGGWLFARAARPSARVWDGLP
jgi:ABC-2 type transport system permease protein